MRCKKCLETFRAPPKKMREDQICMNCKLNNKSSQKEKNTSTYNENVSSKELDISKGQARFLKQIASKISSNDDMMIETKIFVRENWGSPEHFKELCLSHYPNQLSLIIHFFQIEEKLRKVPTKEEMSEYSRFSSKEYEEEFGTWEEFLELLGEDPWYRETKKIKKIVQRQSQKEENYKETEERKRKIESERETLEEKPSETIEEIESRLEELRNIIQTELKDHVETLEKFKMLDEYTNLLSSEKIKDHMSLI